MLPSFASSAMLILLLLLLPLLAEGLGAADAQTIKQPGAVRCTTERGEEPRLYCRERAREREAWRLKVRYKICLLRVEERSRRQEKEFSSSAEKLSPYGGER